MKKIINIIFISCFILMIGLPLVFVNLSSDKLSEVENRYLAKFPNIVDESTGKINKNLLSEFENWFNDNVGFRELFVKLNTSITYKVLRTSPNNSVHVGRDGWFFYTLDNNLKIANGTYDLTDEMLLAIKKEQEFIQQALAKKGIEYVLVLTPSKASVYPEKISGANYSIRETPIDIVTKYLKENTTINVVNTKDELIKAKDEAMVYHKTDTHWNEEGGYVGYRTLVKKLNELGIISSEAIDISRKPSTYKGEFSAMMGDVSLLDAEPINITEISNPKAVQIEKPEVLQILNNVQSGHNYLSSGNYFFENLAGEKKALIYGDSFFGARKILNLLAENFESLNFVWSDKIMNSVVDAVKPDVVIFERTERYLYTLGKQADQALMFEPLKTHEAEIVQHNTPTVIKRGEKYNIEITVKNTSDDIWDENKQVRLCIWQNEQDFGYRIMIPEGQEVKPGEEITFILRDFEAPPNDSTIIEYQMLEEGVTYFGERERIDIQVQS